MAHNNTKISKNDYDKQYLTYNQITKDYDVYILSEDQYNKLPDKLQKEVKYMILIKKSKTNPPEPKGPPAWALVMEERIISSIKQYVDLKIGEVKQEVAEIRQEVAEVRQEVVEIKQEVAETNARIDNLVKKNNLRE